MADIIHFQLLDQIGRAIHEALETVRREPIPERWTELLDRLNAEEEAT